MTKIFILFATLVTGLSAQSYSTGPTYSSGPTYRGSAAAATISVVQTAIAVGITGTVTYPITFGSALTNGNRIACGAQTNTSGATQIFSNTTPFVQTGVTWGTSPNVRGPTGILRLTEIWISGTISSGSSTITTTLNSASAGTSGQGLVCLEIHGLSTGTLDTNNTASATTNPITVPVTTTTANTIVFAVTRAGAATSGTNYSPSNGFTGITPDATDTRGAYAYKILLSTATTDPSWTSASAAQWGAAAVAVK